MYIFKEVLDHVSRVDRVLTSPGGSLLLAGRSGAGRRTAVRLVAHMHHMDLVTPHVSRNYTVKSFKNDLKNVSQNNLHAQVYIQYMNNLHVHVHLDIKCNYNLFYKNNMYNTTMKIEIFNSNRAILHKQKPYK